MKVYYDKPKGKRIKKGSVKWKGRRVRMFSGLTQIYNPNHEGFVELWYFHDIDKWCEFEEGQGRCSNRNNNIKNLKQAIRHIKKQNIPKGTVFELTSNFIGYNIYIVK